MSELILERHRDSIVVKDGSLDLGTYCWSETWQHPHWHPLRARKSGALLTSRAPFDHPWHCGLWWSWKQIDDAMAWNPALHGETSTASARVDSTSIDGSVISQSVVWRHDQSGQTLLNEQRQMRAAVLDENTWSLDWSIACSSDTPRVLSSTPWPEPSWGGYAGLAFRPVRSMAFDESVASRATDGSLLSGDACHGQPGAWLAYSGALDDVALPRAPRPMPRGTIALFNHADNPVPSERWWATGTANNHARFFCLGTGFLMGNTLTVQPGKPLTFRYRVVMSGASLPPECLDRWRL